MDDGVLWSCGTRPHLPPPSTQFASSSSRPSHHHEREILRIPQKQKNQLLFSQAQSHCRAVHQPSTSTAKMSQGVKPPTRTGKHSLFQLLRSLSGIEYDTKFTFFVTIWTTMKLQCEVKGEVAKLSTPWLDSLVPSLVLNFVGGSRLLWMT